MDYLGNNTNIVREADLSATNIVPSSAIYRTDTAPKAGGGVVALSGPYTGQADTVIEVEIADTAGDSSQVSQPVFAGVGNGTMTDLAATAVDVQTFTVTLEDLGTETRAAYVPFQGATLRARATGPDGNAITIKVDASALVATDTDYALQSDLRAGTNEYVGDEWNFDAATLNPDGTIPDTAPRLRFGTDPQVFRAYRFFRAGQYAYAFSPAPIRDVAAGARVRTISGTRTVTISDGTDTDTLAGITTLYDCLSAIRDDSTLVEVDGVIVNDKLPGGQGATDLSVWTQPYVLSLVADGTDHALRADIALAVDATAPTETFTIRCVDATATGIERWEVVGDVSGVLDPATTGVAYADGAYTFTIPLPAVDPDADAGTITVEFRPTDGVRAQMPDLCVVKPRLGVAARNGTWNFIYTERPPEPCDCTTGEFTGGPSDECLGNTDPGGGAVSDASRLIRLQRLTNLVRAGVGSNTMENILARSSTTPVGEGFAAQDILFIQTVATILGDGLNTLASGTVRLPAWEASSAYVIDDQHEPIVANGYRYGVQSGGTSAASEPTWPTTIGTTVSDGTVTWVCLGKTPFGMWDDVLAEFRTQVEILGLISNQAPLTSVWAATTANPINALMRPLTGNGHWYIATAAGTTGASEPTWPTDGTTVVDGTVTWEDQGAYWTPNTTYQQFTVIQPRDGNSYTTLRVGISGATEPDWPGTDGSITWAALVAENTLIADVADEYYERYRTAMTDTLAAAGISPNFEGASANGDGCWQDFGAEFWWVYDGSDTYLPVQTGHYYHSAKLGHDEDGNPISTSTQEFGFGPQFGCPENLLTGDVLRVTISGVPGGGNGYQAGDRFTARINRASPLEMGGGQDGDDTLTWSVIGSVDGRLTDYTLVTTALAAYSDGGIGFSIVPGGIAFALGDTFRFAVEGGSFTWRRDGGAWSADLDIGDTLLADGLTATFAGGTAPSWVTGDRWTFAAEATNGAEGLRQPTAARCAWTGSTVIAVTPDASESIAGILIADHTIPSDATIRLQGSDDDFSTTPTDEVIAWQAGDIWLPVAATRAKWRVTVDKGGSIQWLYLGAPTVASIRTGAAELGLLTKRYRLPGTTARKRLGGDVEHTALTRASVDALVAMLAHACEHDERRFAVVPNPAEPEVMLVEYQDDSLEVEDLFGHQPRDTAHRRQSLRMTLVPVP